METSENNTLSLQVNDFGDIFPHMEIILQCGFYIHNANTGQSTWSAGIYQILGLEPGSENCSFEMFLNYVDPADREMVRKRVCTSLEDRLPYHIEFNIRDAKGNFKRVFTESVLRKSQTDAQIYEGFLKDITERYIIRQSLEVKVQELDKNNQSLQEFVYIASHDLQEPLRKISTFVGRLDQRFQADLPEEARSYLSRILNATHNMQRLLEDLLAFSRLSFEGKALDTVDLNDSVKLAVSDLEIAIEEMNGKIEYENLPVIKGHAHQFKQLFLNLIGNALKFRKADQAPHIQITSKKVNQPVLPDASILYGAFVEIKVVDNGIGFEQIFSEKIFAIFQRLNGKTEFAGSGVGLAICKKIVEHHGGRIYATSELGKGACFTVLLPDNYSYDGV